MGTATLAPTFNFEGSEPGIRRIYGVGYAGTLEVGNTIQEVGGNGGSCAVISENFIEVVIQETADCFSTSTNDETVEDVNQIALDKGFVQKGDMLINLAAMPIVAKGMVNTLRVSEV